MPACEHLSPLDTSGYRPFVSELAALADTPDRDAAWSLAVNHAVNGLASKRLRADVPLETRRAGGHFFTSAALANDVVGSLTSSMGPTSVVWDPACGAGDLLLAANGLRVKSGWTQMQLRGFDIQPEFAEAAQIRVDLVTPSGFASATCSPGCGPCALGGADDVTHVLVNPPYGLQDSPTGIAWTTGVTSSAAVFVDRLIQVATPGTEVVAILPDVLLSGARYRRWRSLIEDRTAIYEVRRLGRFDRWTNVDTFLLRLIVGDTGGFIQGVPDAIDETLGDHFDIGVGAVVHNRDPHTGPNVAFLRSAGLPSGATIHRIAERRRFAGRLESPPFVAVRRTSSPRERVRTRATVVLGKRPVAVDNHLLVLRPRDESVTTCETALAVLGAPETTTWMNHNIACRHLTVGVTAAIPWGDHSA
jgi:hypothetical protein